MYYTKTGKRFIGKTHRMANGQVHTGAKHTSSSRRVYTKTQIDKMRKRKR